MGTSGTTAPACRRLLLLCVLTVITLLCACSGSGAPDTTSRQQVTQLTVPFEIVPLSELPRQVSIAMGAIDPLVPASGPGMVSAGVSFGTSATATASADGFEYAIYADGAYNVATQPRYLLIDALGGSGALWVGISNYETGAWEWSALEEPLAAAMWVRLPDAQAYRADDGMIFVAVVVCHGASMNFKGGMFSEETPFSFSAMYRRIATEDTLGDGAIEYSTMSSDGSKVFTCNYSDSQGIVHVMDADGDNVQQVLLPDTAFAIHDLCASAGGSRLFLTDKQQSVFKVEGGAATRLWVFEGMSYRTALPLTCTDAGDYVYFGCTHSGGMDDRDIWRASAAGALQKVVDDDAVTNSTSPFETAKYLGSPVISGDGDVLAFSAYFPGSDTWELFVLDHAILRQLTTYGDGSEIRPKAVCCDGSTILFERTDPSYVNSLWAINPAGTSTTYLGDLDYNYHNGTLSSDGTEFFYADHTYTHGVMLDVATGDRYPLCTEYPIELDALGPIAFSADSTRVCFRQKVDETYGVQVVDLNPEILLGAGLHIGAVMFSPPKMIRTFPSQGVVVEAAISEGAFVDTVSAVNLTELVDYQQVGSYEDSPLFWSFELKDDGLGYDRFAADGIYTSALSDDGALLNTLNEMTVRIAVRDENYNAFIADTVLEIIGAPDMLGAE